MRIFNIGKQSASLVLETFWFEPLESFDDTKNSKKISDFLDARNVSGKIMRFIITKTLYGYREGVPALTYRAQLAGESRVKEVGVVGIWS